MDHHIINIQASTSSHKDTLDDQVPIKLIPQVDSPHITYNTEIQSRKEIHIIPLSYHNANSRHSQYQHVIT